MKRISRSGWGRRAAAVVMGGLVAGVMSLPERAAAATLTFDDIPACLNTFANAGASNYGGLVWSASWAVECDTNYAVAFGNSYGSPSGDNAAFNGFGEFGVTIDAPANTTMDFLGGMVSSWTQNDVYTGNSSLTLQIDGYLNNVLQGSLVQFLLPGYASLVMGDVLGTLNGVDQLIFYSDSPDAQHSWLLDDAQFALHETVPEIPEPASLVLFGTGLCLVAARLRARRRATTLPSSSSR